MLFTKKRMMFSEKEVKLEAVEKKYLICHCVYRSQQWVELLEWGTQCIFINKLN